MNLLALLSQSLQELVSRTAPSVVSVAHGRGRGSGVLLAPDGFVLTNAHVVQGAKELRVESADGGSFTGRLVGADRQTDIAVVKVDGAALPCLPLSDGAPVQVGQLVVAIGNPLVFDRSVSLGVVSAVDRSLRGHRGPALEGLIQTDAAINPGNSGGPLVDVDGVVVGINTAKVPWAQGIGFAIPSATAAWVASLLMRHGEVRRPQLGIRARSERAGVRVHGVGADSPAQHAGLRDGDVLVSVNGQSIRTIDQLQRALVFAEAPSYSIGVLRGQARHDVTVRPKAA